MTDLATLIARTVELSKRGSHYVGRCPFHREKTPSLSVNNEAGVFYCFGCGVSGNADEWVRLNAGEKQC